MLDIREERIVACAAFEMAVANGLSCTQKRRDDLLRLPPREEDVVFIRDDEHLRVNTGESRIKRTVAVAGIGEVHRTRYVEVGVRVEAAQELHRLVVEIALDLEICLEEAVALGALLRRGVHEVVLEPAAELLLQELAREIRYVRKLARRGKPRLRTLAVAFEIVVAALPVGIVSDGVAAHDAQGDRLGVQARARRDEARLFHVVGEARHPVYDLQSAVATADKRCELLYAELLQEHPEDVNSIVERVLREGRAVGLTSIGIDRHGARRSRAATEHVRADYVEPVRVERTARANHLLPPAAWFFLARPYARDMCIACECMADVDCVGVSKGRAALFVCNLDFLQNAAIGKLEPAVRQVQLHFLQFYYSNALSHNWRILYHIPCVSYAKAHVKKGSATDLPRPFCRRGAWPRGPRYQTRSFDLRNSNDGTTALVMSSK